VRRLEQAGVTVRSFRPPSEAFDFEPRLFSGVRAVSQAWLAAHPGGEKTFGMGRFEARELPSRWLLCAVSAQGRVEGFLTWAEVPAARGWSLDLMRRRADAPAGVMDLLLATSAATARAHGDRVLSLGLSALVSTDESPDAERVRAFLRKRLGGVYDFEGLFHWKRKFRPRLEERFLVVPGTLALPRVLYALARAQSPGGLAQTLGRMFPTRREKS